MFSKKKVATAVAALGLLFGGASATSMASPAPAAAPKAAPVYQIVSRLNNMCLTVRADNTMHGGLGVVRTLELSDIDRIKFVATLARIYQNHSDALPDIALMIL
ncbi:hypothetical protein ACFQ1S_40070, partial [Kibdelosporangium lantanae]